MLSDIFKDTVVIIIGLVIPAVWVLMKYPFKRKLRPQPTEPSAFDFGSSIFAPPTPEPDPAPFWRLLERVPFCQRLAWRRIYTLPRISSKIRVQVSGGESGMKFYWSAEASSASIWLYIVNLNPFPLTIDRMIGELTVANSTIAPVQDMKRKRIQETSDDSIWIEITITDQQARRANFQKKHDKRSGVNLTLYVTTPFGEIEHPVRLTTSNNEYANFHLLDSD